VKTVLRNASAAQGSGLTRERGEAALTNEFLATLISALQGDPTGSAEKHGSYAKRMESSSPGQYIVASAAIVFFNRQRSNSMSRHADT